ncbi:MAG TPA: DNA repair protein RecO [Deltaproteobacteria bacterium]|nr:DNA repair protein RecO [Deltaproteobacteria bacterium]
MKGGHTKTSALILGAFDYGESDRIVTFLTDRSVKLRAIAKGAKRSRRRFVGNLDPLSLSSLLVHLSPRSTLARIDDASLLREFSGIKTSVERLAAASYVAELASEMTGDGQQTPGLFPLVTAILAKIDDGAPTGPLLRSFEMRLLAAAGYLPHLSGCVACRRPLRQGGGAGRAGRAAAAPHFFSAERGGLLCARCAAGAAGSAGLMKVSPGAARFLTMAARLDPAKLQRLVPSPSLLAEGEELLGEFIRHHLGKELKTRLFMNKIRQPPSRGGS